MNNITIEDLLNVIKEYNPSELDKVKKAYEYAAIMHQNQVRQSGEPYIIHPLNVTYILASLHADGATLCAGLLHDTLEDTLATKEELINLFGELVATLVDGVTKLNKKEFNHKEDAKSATIRKIINSLRVDARIIIIKLADRLHNMRTLEYKKHNRQIDIASETLKIFVPLAYFIGVNQIKSELEELCLKYLKPEEYKKSEQIRNDIINDNKDYLDEMIYKIHTLLNEKEIPNEIKLRIKNIYGVYKRMVIKKSDPHDLIALKILVDEVDDCYLSLGYVHTLYHPNNKKFKDYICSPKTNMYQSIHSTVFGENGLVVQTQIRTKEMDFIASNGLPAYWDLKKEEAKTYMQNKIEDNKALIDSLLEIDNTFKDNKEFLKQVQKDIFNSSICIYTMDGNKIFLPKGATAVDFAYAIHTDIGNHLYSVLVNGEEKNPSYVLQNNDSVQIITSEKVLGPDLNWLDKVKTNHALKRIKEYYKKK